MQDKLEKLKEIIASSDYVLIGIGSEFSCTDINPELLEMYMEKNKGAEDNEWLVPFLKSYDWESEQKKKIIQAYNNLYKIIKGKNYFVVTLNEDDNIISSLFEEDKITAPCGSRKRLQCVKGCRDSIVEAEKIVEGVVEDLKNPMLSLNDIVRPICHQCGGEMVFNIVEEEHYLEEGYLKSWQRYKMWLTGTLNKKICLLELGVDFKYPSVIRWAFEKVAFINEKATMVRINEKYPQLTPELQGKAHSFNINAVDFFYHGSV